VCAIDDAEPWDVYRVSVRTARKAHRCTECGRPIAVGESYRFLTGLLDGRWSTYRTCAHCLAAGEWLDVMCGGYLLGGLAEELREHWESGYQAMDFARLIAGLRWSWHDGRDPVPTGVREMAARMLAEAVH
jgi:hypothetical protein